MEVSPEFVVWSENPAGNRLQLPRFFVDELPTFGLGGLWLQADGCYRKASWVAVETSAAGNIALARGWQAFAHTCDLGRRCTLHFKYDDESTLYMRVFGEDGRCAGCCLEDDDRGCLGSPGTDQDEDGDRRTGGGARGSLSFGDSLSGSSSSSGGHDQPPRRHARLGEGRGSARRRAPVKREEGSA